MEPVEVTEFIHRRLTELPHNLDGRDIVTLQTVVLQLHAGVVPRPEAVLPPAELLPAPHGHVALRARLPAAVAHSLARWLGSQALRALTDDLALLRALPALRTTRGPRAQLVLTGGHSLAWLGRGCLGSWTIMILPGVALHTAGLGARPTLGGALAPLADNPVVFCHHCRPDRTNSLHAIHRSRSCNRGLRALRGHLALHGALGLRALLRLLALPGTLGARTHRLAPHVAVPTIQHALGLLTSSCALGRLAVQALLALARIRGAEHRAVRLPALDLATLECLGAARLRAPRLASRNPALRMAGLLTDGLLAAPGAVWHAALPVVVRHQLLPRAAGEIAGVDLQSHCNRPVGQRSRAAPGDRVVVEGLPAGLGHRDPHVTRVAGGQVHVAGAQVAGERGGSEDQSATHG
mmetsp:Transcript_52050/g.114235  ORF Transcript_52050/g.114235 Transcript_52050/m.114235 type:complete len:408 (-) Transcript_52050:88-1311(-)